jgi:hypothetical protein
MVRNWKAYSKEKWIDLLNGKDLTISQNSVEDMSNYLETIILKTLQANKVTTNNTNKVATFEE